MSKKHSSSARALSFAACAAASFLLLLSYVTPLGVGGVPRARAASPGAAVAAAPGDLTLEGLEVTQSVQNMDHGVPLIKGKRTVVRAYLKVDSAAPVTLKGRLLVKRSRRDAGTTVDSTNEAVIDPALNSDLRSRRENLRASLNFILPAALNSQDHLTVSLSAVTDASTGSPVTCTDCARRPRTVDFVEAPVFRLRLIGLRYSADTDNDPATPEVMVEPSQRDFDLIRSWLLRAYPVAQADIAWRTVDAKDYSLKWPFDSSDANAAVAAIRRQDVQSGTDNRTHYYGLVADAGGLMRGAAYTPTNAPDPSAVGSGPTGTPGKYTNFDWDTDDSLGDFYTGHEVGHTFGRNHYGACGSSSDDSNYEFRPGAFLSSTDGAYVGFDAGDAALNLPAAVLPGRAWTDVMDYCRFEWVSSYTYKAILQRLRAENEPPRRWRWPGRRPEALLTLRSGRLINVVALVNLTRETGEIRYVNPVDETLEPPQDGGREAVLRLRGAGGQALGEFPVTLKRDDDARPGEDRKALVDATIPYVPGARTLELVVGGKVLDTFSAGGGAPSLRNLRLPQVGNLNGAASAPLTLRWEGADPDRDRVTYTVQASGDRGATWETLAVGMTASSLAVEFERLRGKRSVRFRVIATDGFRRRILTGRALPLR